MAYDKGMFSRARCLFVPAALMAAASALHAGTDTVAIEDIGPTEEMLRTTPSDEGKISDGDESVVDRVFVYLDGCPLVMLDGVGAAGADVTMVDRDGEDGAPAKAGREGCIPNYDAASKLPPRDGMALKGTSEQAGLLVQLWQDAPQRDADGVLIDDGDEATLVIEIASLIPQSYLLMAGDDPIENPHRRNYNTPDGRFQVPDALGSTPEDLITVAANGDLSTGRGNFGGGGGGFSGGSGGFGGSGGSDGGSSVSSNKPTTAAAVPLPGALGLLFAGLTTIGGLVALRRRRLA